MQQNTKQWSRRGAVIGLVLALGLGLDAPAGAANQNQSLSVITQIVSRDADETAIFLTGPYVSADSCTGGNDRGIIRPSDPGAKTLLATAILAFSLDKQVEVAVDGCAVLTSAASTFPRIVKIKLVR